MGLETKEFLQHPTIDGSFYVQTIILFTEYC